MLRRLSVTPGLTCLWQIRGRSDLGFEEWMRLDLEYVDRQSFQLDLTILALTLAGGALRPGRVLTDPARARPPPLGGCRILGLWYR